MTFEFTLNISDFFNTAKESDKSYMIIMLCVLALKNFEMILISNFSLSGKIGKAIEN